jgi:hypothetical protein
VLDGLHLAMVEAPAAVHMQGHRSARLDLLAAEQLAPRQHEMDPRRAHVGERPDGARELALERAAQVDVGEKLGGAERALLIEDLVADGAAPRQPLFGERHTQAQRLIRGNQYDAPVTLQLEGDAQRLEAPDDRGAVVKLELAVQQGVVRLGDPQQQECEQRQQAERGRAQHQEARRAKAAQDRGRLAERRGPVRRVAGGLVRGRRCPGERLIHRLVDRGPDAPLPRRWLRDLP